MISNQKMSIILPARIVEYFEATQTATIQISAESVFSDTEDTDELTIRRPLKHVPVHTPYGGGWSITFPIKEGDSCLLVFSQVGYHHWLQEDKDTAGLVGGRANPTLYEQFTDDNALALVGFNTLPRAIQNYTTDGSQWRNEDATQNIHLKDDLSIEINSPNKVVINAPSITVNCETAEVNASSSVSIDTPEASTSNNLSVGGNLSVTGNISGSDISGSGSVSGSSVSAGSVSLSSHTHQEHDGYTTSAPT